MHLFGSAVNGYATAPTFGEWENFMASGKAIGEFSMKMITNTISPGPAGSILLQVNFEGTATGFGTVIETATFVGGGKDGTFSIAGSAFLDNGDVISALVKGPTKVRANIDGRRRTSGSCPMGAELAIPVRSIWLRVRGREQSLNS